MSFKDRISKFVNVNEGDYYDDVDDTEFDDDEYEDVPAEQDIPVTKKSGFGGGFRAPEKQRSSNVVDFSQPTQPQRAKGQVVLAKPATFDEATGIADHINQKHMVILNLEATSRDIARRLVDFLSGVVYANTGSIRRIANSTFIIVPQGYDLSGEMIDSIENGGIYFG